MGKVQALNFETVIVGGGIAGSSLAYVLARASQRVIVLERTTEFRDVVRGEGMHVWGVREARRLEIDGILEAAGSRSISQWHQYMQGREVRVVPMNMIDPDIGGTLSIRHPVACQALLDAAANAGAHVIRGVADIEVDVDKPAVRFRTETGTAEVRAQLIVGADGRRSATRRQAGISLDQEEATTWVSGMLVEHPTGVPNEFDATAAGEHPLMVLNHQSNRRTRVYLCGGPSLKERHAGPSGPRRFLEDCGTTCYPWAPQLSQAKPAGPCATFPGDDSWTDTPFARNVVLIGDAAGHTDPIMGQGLSIALRDVRIVAETITGSAGSCSPDFSEYGAERSRRLERLRLAANIIAAATAEDAPNRRARVDLLGDDLAAEDSRLRPVLFGGFAGPETVDDHAVDHSLPDLIRNVPSLRRGGRDPVPLRGSVRPGPSVLGLGASGHGGHPSLRPRTTGRVASCQ